MKLYLKIWRQENTYDAGKLMAYTLEGVSDHMSFLEMMDFLNEELVQRGERVIEFDHDCREGICGQCGFVINGSPHGPLDNTTTCQLHMRSFKDGDTLVLEPFRARAFPVVRDLKINRSSFDRIIQANGYISSSTGQAPEANSIPIGHDRAEEAFDAAACIGCGACVASCKNASASLFTAAKVTHLALLPQGEPEAGRRVLRMVAQMDSEGFGACTFTGACETVCPQEISISHIARMNYEYHKAVLKQEKGT